MKIQQNKILYRRNVLRQCELNKCIFKSVVNSFAVLRSRALSPFVQLLPVTPLLPVSLLLPVLQCYKNNIRILHVLFRNYNFCTISI
jgi:hypothetical protein